MSKIYLFKMGFMNDIVSYSKLFCSKLYFLTRNNFSFVFVNYFSPLTDGLTE